MFGIIICVDKLDWKSSFFKWVLLYKKNCCFVVQARNWERLDSGILLRVFLHIRLPASLAGLALCLCLHLCLSLRRPILGFGFRSGHIVITIVIFITRLIASLPGIELQVCKINYIVNMYFNITNLT